MEHIEDVAITDGRYGLLTKQGGCDDQGNRAKEPIKALKDDVFVVVIDFINAL